MTRPVRTLFGLEFEVAFTAIDIHGNRVNQGTALEHLMDVALGMLPHLKAHRASGVFLQNGSRLYLDCGKPEITTPEVLTPADACRYARAGEEILLDVGQVLVDRVPEVAQIIFSRSNVSYGGAPTTWACHESYCHTRGRARLTESFLPHAVSRIIYTGSGGFDNRSRGICFMLSPRVAHLEATVSQETQRNRGIYNTKQESLAGGSHSRLHVICGENVSSIRAQWLKMGTTALVIAMIDAGLRPGANLVLEDPLGAMRLFAEDTSLAATARTSSGRQLRALDIQRCLLEQARDFVEASSHPEWLATCCDLWQQTLDQLEQGPTAVQRTLDWAIKLDLYRHHIHKAGLSWEDMARWDRLLTTSPSVSAAAPGNPAGAASDPARSLQFPPTRFRAARAGVRRKDLDKVLSLRNQLYELDTRFGQLGAGGIFNYLDQAGQLDHDAPGVVEISAAKTEPPSGGRAAVRGAVVRRLAAQATDIYGGWSGVWDYEHQRFLDLSDPFLETESWTSLMHGQETGHHDHGNPAEDFVNRAFACFRSGQYDECYRALELVGQVQELLAPSVRRDVTRCLAWVQARRGLLSASRTLVSLLSDPSASLRTACDHAFIYRFQGLAPAPEMSTWVARAMELVPSDPSSDAANVAELFGYRAFELLCAGDVAGSLSMYDSALELRDTGDVLPRLAARLLTERADSQRRLGNFDESASCLAEAEVIQRGAQLTGDIADFCHTALAKLEADTGNLPAARRRLKRAAKALAARGHEVGALRSLLLMARLNARRKSARVASELADIRSRIDQLRSERPALAACRLLSKITEQWQVWIAGETLDGETDRFWNL